MSMSALVNRPSIAPPQVRAQVDSGIGVEAALTFCVAIL